MRVLRVVMGVTAVATTLSVGVASAAGLGTASDGKLAAGSASVQRCDTDGVTAAFTYSGNDVSSVTVSGIHANCGDAALSYTLTNSSGVRVASSNGSVTVPTGGGTAPALAVAAPLPASSTVSTVTVLMLGGQP